MLISSRPHKVSVLISNLYKSFIIYRNYFFMCGTISILVITSMIFLHYRSVEKEVKALDMLAGLENFYINSLHNSESNYEKKYYESKDKFLEAINNLGTKNQASSITKIILGNLSYNADDFENAITLYSNVLKKLNNTAVLKNLVLAKVAYCYLSIGNLDKAEVCFNQIMSGDRSIMQDEALFNIALLHESNNDLVSAKEIYNQFLTHFPNSPYNTIIKQKIG